MNERISELVNQAMVEARFSIDPNTFFPYHDPNGPHTRMDFSAEKFAELIVRECAQVAFEGDLKRAIGQWGSHSDILKHFGVEYDVVRKFRDEE